MKVTVIVRGKTAEWGFNADIPREAFKDMTADGVQVFEVVNSIPWWAAAAGLTKPWFFCHDVFNFRNPFRAG